MDSRTSDRPPPAPKRRCGPYRSLCGRPARGSATLHSALCTLQSHTGLRAALAALLLGLLLTACGGQAAIPTPTPATPPTAAPAPATRIPATPVLPTAVPATPVPQPTLSFSPASGGPGTRVQVFGSGYPPGSQVAIRLGRPEPVGEVLAGARADASGSWAAELIIPERLPSGEPIGSPLIMLVAMDEQNRPLAWAPFSLGGEPPPIAGTATIPEAWPGLGWRFALESDLNRDGLADRVYYRPSAVAPDGTSFGDPRLDAVAVVAEAVIVGQPAADGQLVFLTVDLNGAHADIPLFRYDGVERRRPAAYLLALDPAQGPTINLLPIGPGGAAYGGPFGIDWDPQAGGLRVVN